MTYISQLVTLLFMLLGGDRILAHDVRQTYRRLGLSGSRPDQALEAAEPSNQNGL